MIGISMINLLLQVMVRTVQDQGREHGQVKVGDFKLVGIFYSFWKNPKKIMYLVLKINIQFV